MSSIFAHSGGSLAGASAGTDGAGPFAPGATVTFHASATCPGGGAPSVNWVYDLLGGDGIAETDR